MIDLSIRRPVFAWVLMISMIIFGAISLNKLAISQMPDVDFPILNISLVYEGATPEVVEADLIEPIEKRLLQIEGIKEMRSSAAQGFASVNLEFDLNHNVDVALQEVQSALSQLVLPPNVDPPIIKKSNPEEDPILVVAIYGGASVREMLLWVNHFLIDQLQFLPGVGQVTLTGFPDPNMRVWIDPQKLKRYQLTVNDVTEALKSQQVESSAGQFVQGQKEIRLSWQGEAISPDEIGEFQIHKRGGESVDIDTAIEIKDVARVETGLSDVRRLARVNGKEALALQIRKQRGSNEVTVAEAVKRKLLELETQNAFPKGVKHQITVNFTKSTKATVHLTKEKLIIAALVTIFVCFLFLGSVQAALNILISLPTSIIGTFTILYFSGFTLNLFTLLALTLAISIVVDDAIMLLENIVRHYRMGKTAKVAAADGSKEVLPAAIAATLAVVAVFLPVIFMSGVVGKFFFQFGVTLSAAVLLSLVEALTITPMRAAAFFSSQPKVSKFENKLEVFFENLGDAYRRLLVKTLRWRWAVVILSAGFFVLSLFLISRVRQEFVPPQDQDLIILTAQSKPGSSLEATNQISLEIEKIIKAQPEVQDYLVTVGGGSSFSLPTSLFIPIILKNREERSLNHSQIMAQLRKKFKIIKEAKISMRDISARNLTTGRLNPVAFNLRGPDLQILSDKAKEMISLMEKEGLALDLDTDFRKGIPELKIIPDRKAMGLRGVSASSISQLLMVAIGGYRQGQYTSEGKRYDIRFKIPEELIVSPEDIKNLDVRSTGGYLIPVRHLVKTEMHEVLQSISRINRQRSVSVYGNLGAGLSQSKVLERTQEIAKQILPSGYSFNLEGAAAGFSESFKSLLGALLIGILVAYLILAVQFDSFLHPISVLVALPFSVTGALLTLWLTGTSLNLFSFIGLIVLMGIAKKNSIMLVEFTNKIRQESQNFAKLSIEEALLKACPVRLRPILMTSLATVGAALPLVLGGGIGSETRLPMGLTIIGGTVVSTILTLFVVPALHSLLVKDPSPYIS